jgi:hypothetical protein
MDFSSSSSAGCGEAKQVAASSAGNGSVTRKRTNLYDEYENIAMAKDRAARSRYLGERRSHGLEPRALSDSYGWIDLGIYGGPVQRDRLFRLARTR